MSTPKERWLKTNHTMLKPFVVKALAAVKAEVATEAVGLEGWGEVGKSHRVSQERAGCKKFR